MSTYAPLHRMLSAMPAHLHAAATERYERHGFVLAGRLARLYGDTPGCQAWLGDLMESVGQLIAARAPALHLQDASRERRPGWFTHSGMLGYSAYVANFGGSLRGVAGRIAYLRELGVTYLHLLPFLRSRRGENDGGFAVSSFDEVDPALGDNADLDALTAALRAAGISLCCDLVLNHVADDHPWAQAAAAGDPRYRDYFHVFPDRVLPDQYEQALGQVFAQAAPGNFTRVDAMGGWVWTTFYPFQWDLNYANPAVFGEMVKALLRLANRGVEAFRLDSTAFLWKRAGTDCMNQPEVHELLQALRAIVEIAAPGVLLKAEAIVPTFQLPAYLGKREAPECHLAYHSTLMAAGWAALAEQDTAMLRLVAGATPALPPGASWLTYVRCHDDIGWNILRPEAGSRARLERVAHFYGGAPGSFAAGVAFQCNDADGVTSSNGMAAALAGIETAATDEQRQHAVRRLLLLYGLAFAFGGLPVIYMGDELAQQNDHAYARHDERAHDTRWVQRAPFDQQRLARRHDRASAAGQLFGGLRELAQRRLRIDALAAGVPVTVLPAQQPALLALARGSRFVYLGNFSAAAIELDLAEYGAAGTLTLAPWAMHWLELEGS